MRLLGMEIQGFKSFPDKTKLEFNDGFTAVVGPNGSGKSNIADALRWVLGEQSSRSLRGNRMEDVIFGGTQGRKPLASCSVTLFLDNKDRSLPYNEDEVAISRKYYRSGDSEFRINKTVVRLMDIHEIFMDTGLGRDGYSIIGQGKIAEIVSAKSSERREIFEEAAGISKFRYRKRDAEKRLDNAEENLLRLKDILLELANRIEPLRKDSEKAERFLELSARKKSWEISIWAYQLEQMRERLKKLSDEVFLEDKRYKEAGQEVESLENIVNSLYEGIQKQVIEMDILQKQILDDQEILSNSSSTKAVLENDISHNTRTLTEISEKLLSGVDADAEMQSREKKIRENLKAVNEQFEIVKQNDVLLKEKSNELQNQSLSVDSSGQEHRVRRTTIYRLLDEKKTAYASGKAIVDETTTQLESFKLTLFNSKSNIEDISLEKQEISDLISQLDKRISTLSNQISHHKQQQHLLEETYKKLEFERNNTNHEMQGLKQKAKLLEDMDKNMEGYAGSVKFVINSSAKGMLKGIIAPVSSVIKVDSKFSVAIEVALGAAMQNIITENEESAKAAIRLLASRNSGRATFLPLTTIRGNVIKPNEIIGADGYIGIASELISYEDKFSGIANSLLGRIVIAENLDKATALAKKSSYRYRIVTLDGQVLNTGGSMTGGSMARSAGILGRSGQIEELLAKASQKEQQIRDITSNLETSKRDIDGKLSEINSLSLEVRHLEDDRIGYLSEAKRITQSLSQAEDFFNSSKSRLEEMSTRLLKNENLSQEVELEIAKLETELQTLEEEITGGNFRREKLQEDRKILEDKLSENRTQYALLEREITALTERLEELINENSSRKSVRLQLESEKARLAEENENLHLRIENLGIEKMRLKQRIEYSNKTVSEKAVLRNNMEAELNQKRQLQRQAEVTRDNSYRSLVERQSKLESLENNHKSIVNNLWESYELTIAEAAEMAQKISDLQEAMSALSEIKGKIRSLGNVNLGAIEEYEDVLTRHSELSAQIKDIENARKELLELIGQLTQSMCLIFSEKFAAVDRCFREIFVDLFGGGKASLSLSDPDNVLESGIEINVQPPGKVIKSLTLLSGGEQAFIAIAIYFAILKVNPSPFCLLDEIEAALDDVNVSKFARYLCDLTSMTQFLVITHRRGTMEEAQRLYGVTMQEDGVSKLLELKTETLSNSMGLKE